MTDDPGQASSAVRRWQLAETLRQLREQAELTHDEVIEELRKVPGKWSRAKLSRVETRAQGIKPREVEQLLDVYRVADTEVRQRLTELAGASRERGWVVDIRKHLPQDFHRYVDWETVVVSYRQFETLLVPGLLQTADYARALISGINPNLTEEEVERRVMARTTRQQLLGRANPPQLHVILDAGVLERPVGSEHLMRNQLRRLTEATELPNISIQVLPKSVGASPALEGPFSVLTLPEPIPDVGYAEGPSRAVYIEDRNAVRDYTLRFGILTEQAMSCADSATLIAKAATNYA